VGVGVEFDQESDSELLVPTLRHGKLGVQLRETVWKSESDRMGARKFKDFVQTKNLSEIVSLKVMSYGRIEP